MLDRQELEDVLDAYMVTEALADTSSRFESDGKLIYLYIEENKYMMIYFALDYIAFQVEIEINLDENFSNFFRDFYSRTEYDREIMNIKEDRFSTEILRTLYNHQFIVRDSDVALELFERILKFRMRMSKVV
jgi:hypothetical protein